MADRYPLWNVELARTEQLVDNRRATSVSVMTGADESKTRVMMQLKKLSRRAPSTRTANLDSMRSVVGHGRLIEGIAASSLSARPSRS